MGLIKKINLSVQKQNNSHLKIYLKTIKYVVTDTYRYGRSIAMIYCDANKYLSAQIIKAGMGWHYKRYSTSKALAIFEDNAKKIK